MTRNSCLKMKRNHSQVSSSESLFDTTFPNFADSPKRPLLESEYKILGFISSGTYGNVFKAERNNQIFAIKKFKPEKEGKEGLNVGISQSAIREIGLCRELSHENIIKLENVMLDPAERSIAMVFDYAEHDLLQILHYHTVHQKSIPEYTIKSFIWQILNGISFMHKNWVMHRDLKPANIMVTKDGCVKIGDLGLARLYQAPIVPLYNSDKVIVTIWYRAPELLLNSRHYTKEIDVWAIGCILGELWMLKPIFKGEEAKLNEGKSKGQPPFQKDQVAKIIDILGYPDIKRWPGAEYMPSYKELSEYDRTKKNVLRSVYDSFPLVKGDSGYRLLSAMLEYNPDVRITADAALDHQYFTEKPMPGHNSFICPPNKVPWVKYPQRKLQDGSKFKN